jgi:hypothetical protein
MVKSLGTNRELLAEAVANLHVELCRLDGRTSVVKDVYAAWWHLRNVLNAMAEKAELASSTYKSIGMVSGPADINAVRARVHTGLLKRSKNLDPSR